MLGVTSRMSSTRRHVLALLACGVTCATAAVAEQVSLSHTPWELHAAGVVKATMTSEVHGDPLLYRAAPPVPGAGFAWSPLTGAESDPRNPVDIDYLGPNDNYSSDLRSCLSELEFTYFQTFVTVPAGFLVRDAHITLGPLDDGSRVLVFTSEHPQGIVPENGYVLLGDTQTIDLARYVKSGETNRFVVEHLDDCAGQAWLGTVTLQVKGETSAGTARPTWGRLKALYR